MFQNSCARVASFSDLNKKDESPAKVSRHLENSLMIVERVAAHWCLTYSNIVKVVTCIVFIPLSRNTQSFAAHILWTFSASFLSLVIRRQKTENLVTECESEATFKVSVSADEALWSRSYCTAIWWRCFCRKPISRSVLKDSGVVQLCSLSRLAGTLSGTEPSLPVFVCSCTCMCHSSVLSAHVVRVLQLLKFSQILCR